METAKVIQLPVMDSLGPAADYRCLPSVPLHAAVVIVPFFISPASRDQMEMTRVIQLPIMDSLGLLRTATVYCLYPCMRL